MPTLCFLLGRPAEMDDDKFKRRMKKMKRRYSNPTPAVLRITGSVVTMVLLLLTICCGFQLTIEPGRYRAIGARAFHVGISTIIFGFLFLIVGLSILADMLLNISEQLPELSGVHQGRLTFCFYFLRMNNLGNLCGKIALNCIWLVDVCSVKQDNRRQGRCRKQ